MQLLDRPLCVVIPVFNEADTIQQLLEIVLSQSLVSEVVVVDDCSTDNTFKKLQEVAVRDTRVRVQKHSKNKGKGAAIRTGIRTATAPVVIIQDADLEYDPTEYSRIIGPILSGKADVVYGSRFIGVDEHRVLFFWHSVGNRCLTLLSNMFTNLNLTDMETCYKAFRTELIQSIELHEDRFGFEPEVTAKLARKSVNIYEVAVSYHGRTFAEGKKIGWKDGISAIRCIIKYGLLRY